MNNNALNLLLEKIGNIEARIHSVQIEMIDYMEKNPKGDGQWTEERLRALEALCKALDHYHCNIMEPRLMALEAKVKNLETCTQKYYEDDRKQLEDEINHSNWNEDRKSVV